MSKHAVSLFAQSTDGRAKTDDAQAKRADCFISNYAALQRAGLGAE
jgi:hypothetical protein